MGNQSYLEKYFGLDGEGVARRVRQELGKGVSGLHRKKDRVLRKLRETCLLRFYPCLPSSSSSFRRKASGSALATREGHGLAMRAFSTVVLPDR